MLRPPATATDLVRAALDAGLGTVRDADLILVLSEGRVVEHGTRHSLMAAGQVYARLFALQSTGYRQGPGECQPALPAGRS